MHSGQALVEALLYGKLDGLAEETTLLFARTGLIHLFSASGFHLWAAVQVADVLAFPALFFLKSPRARDVVRFACRFLFMLFFGQATDWSSPMVRAFVFVSLGAGSRLLEVQANRHWIFLLSLVCSAALGKGSTLSFLLSAAGMAGVLYIEPRRPWAMALGPWLFTLPITIFCFGMFPLLAPLWNLSFGLLISWTVLPLAILGLVGNSLGIPVELLNRAAAWLMEALTAALRAAADEAGLAFWVRPLPWMALAAAIIGAQFLWKERRPRCAAAGLAIGILAAFLWPVPTLSILNVGQGDAILLHSHTLVDVGPPGYLGSTAPVSRGLEALGVGALENILLSHFDLDHRGGLDSVLARHPVKGALWFREENLSGKNAPLVIEAAERVDLPIRFLQQGRAPPEMKCWLPPSTTGNDSSPLCRAELTRGRAVLLTGDMSEKTESWFLHTLRPFPRAGYLKVAHHGSRSSSEPAFLKASGARVALISVGAKNRYHHPTQEVLTRLNELGMRVRRTDREGSLLIY